MIKQQDTGTVRSVRRGGSGRAALMLSAGTLALVLAQPALAQVGPTTLPSGGTIVTGTGGIDATGADMVVTQTSDRLLIDWDSFDIGSGATVHFEMDATDIAVNRDNAGDPSEIYGALTGDGMIMILNPNGVLFGAGANVNVGSLVATTASLADVSSNLLSFTGAAGAVTVAAGANITVADAGLAAFVAPSVANNGVITATAGQVFLGGAEGFTLDLANDGLLQLTVPTASPLVENHGDIFAAGGRIQMSAAAASALVGAVINVEGVLSVASASSDDGVIVLEAAGNAIEVSDDLAVEGDIEFNARRVFGAGDVDVDDGALTLNIDPDGADTTGETLIADALGVIGAVAGGTTLNLAAGDYAAGASINAANVTVDGGGVARIIADQNGQDGLIVNGTGDGAVIQGLTFIGQADAAYDEFAWGSTITRGVVLRNGAENVTVTNNVITGVRNGILIDGRNDGSIITDNVIDNTKSAISVQYTDGSNLTLTGNAEGAFGNEWGINVHLNGVWNGSTISPSAGSLGANPSAAAQQHLLDLSNANSGMSVYNQAYSASNRTHVYVDANGSPTGQGAAPTPISTVQGGVSAVVNGGQVFVADGLYTFTSTLNIDKSLSLIGESMNGVIFDGTAINGYGMEVNADDVTLANFTFQGNNASTNSGHYGIKVQPDTGDASDRVHDFTIQNVAIQGWGGTELDLNGVVGALIDGVIADGQNTKGVGIGLTDSADVTIVNSETLNNLWGSVALYQTNRFYDQQVDNITIDANLNSFGEALGVFAQSYSEIGLEIGQLNLTGFDFVVRNTGHRANGDEFTFFRTDQDDAVNFALHIGAAETSSIEGWSGTHYTNVFTVVNGLTISAAIRDARDDGLINVGAGTYNESVLIDRANLTLVSTVQHGAVIDAGGAAFGINIASNAGDLGVITIDGFSVQNWTTGGINQSMSAAPFASVHVLNNRVFGPDGGAIAHGNGIQVSGDGSIVRGNHVTNTFLNSEDWAGSGILVVNGSGITVEDNIVDGADVGIAVMNYNNASGMSGVTISGNQVSGASEGVSLQAYGGVVSGVTITGNTISGNESGLGMWNYNGHTGLSGVVSGNDFSDNQVHVSSAFDGFVVSDVLSGNSFDRTIHAADGASIYGDLSYAASDAAAGSDLLLSADVFVEDEQILIDRDLTLTGVDGTIIEAGRNFTGANPNQAWWLVEEGVTFGLTGVTLDGAGFNVAYGVRNHGHTTIDDVTFRNIVSAGYGGIAVASFGGDVAGGAGVGSWSDSSLTITGSAFENIGRIGVLVKGDGATARIEDSVFTGRGDGDHVEYAVEAGASGSIEVIGNIITGYRGVAESDGSNSAGILVTSYYGGASTAVIENNVITGNTSAVSVGYGGTDVSVVEAFNNDLSGNDFGVSLNSAASADFSGNWWGFVADTDVAAYMAGAQAGEVDFSTYLVSGADSAGAGFQGDFSVVAVTALGGQTGVGGRIQEGVNLVDTGGVVQVGEGEFSDRTITLGRSVTLLGAQSGNAAATGDGEAGAGDRGGETVLSGSGSYIFRVTAEDVTIDGFTFTGGGGRLIETSGTAHGLSIVNNIFNTPSGHASNGLIYLIGSANDVLIANNLFSGDGGAGYLWLSGAAGDGLAGLTVQNNDFSGVSDRGIFQGGQQFSGFELSGNYFGSGILTGVNMGHLINPLIQGNHFDGVGYAAMQIGVIGGGTIRDNLVDGTGVTGYDFGAYSAAYGIQIWGGAYGTPSSEGLVIEGNTVLNYAGGGADDRFVGIYIGADAGPDIQVTGNTLSGNSIGLWSASAASGLTLTDNIFTVAAGGLAIRNSGSATIELMGGANTINSVDTDSASLEELFGIEDLIDHGLDQTGYGLVRVVDGQLFVTQNSGSIQRAVDLSGAGEIINVGAGTYGGFGTAFGGPEDLTITGADGAIIDGAGVTGRIVDLRADGTTLSGFTIQGDGNGVGVSISGRGVTVSGNTITDVLTGVQTTTQSAAGDAFITGNTISADYGISLQNTGNTVSGNTVNAVVEGVGLLQGANSFSGNTFTIAAGGDALNLYGTASATDMTGEDNTVTIAGGGLQGAVDLALDNGTVNVGDGTYAEDVLVSGVRTLLFGDVAVDGLTLTTAAAGSGLSGRLTASGDIVFDGAVILTDDLTLTGSGVSLTGVDGSSQNGQTLVIDADAISIGSAGAATALRNLMMFGDTTLTGGVYNAFGFAVSGAATLANDVSITVTGPLSMGSVDGAHDLSIVAGGPAALGAVGANEALASLTLAGSTITTAGAVTTGGQTYAGALTLNGDYAAGGAFSVNGAATLSGDVSIITQGGDIMLGLVDGAHGLTIGAGAGDVILGPVGSSVAVDDLIVTGGVVTTAGASSTGDQVWSSDEVRLSGGFTTAGGDFTVSGPATLNGATTIATAGGDASLGSVNGAVAGGQAFSVNAGSGSIDLGSLGALARLGAVVVRANSTVLNSDTYAANSLSFMGAGADATVRLTELLTTFSTVQSAGQAGAITIAPHLIGTVDGEQGVVFLAGTGASAGDGAITLGDAGSDDLRLGLMTATGGDFSAATVMLAGDFTSTLSGDQLFTDNTLDTLGDVNATVAGDERGPINAGGSVILNVGGTSNGAITAGGPVSVTSGGDTNRNITSGGSVVLTSTGGSVGGSVDAEGPVTVNSAGTITGSYASGGDIIFVADQPIDVQVDGDVVQVDAPGGVVTGVFSEITTDEAGTFVINGETVVGTGSADARQILIDGFIAPVGGVVGPTGLIQLPVGLALALVSPAGAGEGQRPAVLVNDVDRLGELLRLGYTAIVIQIDESGLLIEEELILADTEQQQAAGAH